MTDHPSDPEIRTLSHPLEERMPRYTDPDGFPEIVVLDSIKRGSINLARIRRTEPAAGPEADDAATTPTAPGTAEAPAGQADAGPSPR